jgi:membrane-bound lytic murein transglycosylase F
MGIMQLMPGTLKEMEGRLGIRINPYNPRLSIMVGIAYDKRMYGQFKRPTVDERLPWMFAAYNAGLGNVLRHQRACGGTRNYELVKPCLYEETRTYVERIRRYYVSSNS